MYVCSALQKKCSLLSKQLGDAETSQAESRRLLLRSELKMQELASANLDLEAEFQRVERQGKLEVQRTKIFEGEVMNLRALLKVSSNLTIYIHTYIQTYKHTCIHTYIHTYI